MISTMERRSMSLVNPNPMSIIAANALRRINPSFSYASTARQREMVDEYLKTYNLDKQQPLVPHIKEPKINQPSLFTPAPAQAPKKADPDKEPELPEQELPTYA